MAPQPPKPPKSPDDQQSSDVLRKMWQTFLLIVAIVFLAWLFICCVRLFFNAVLRPPPTFFLSPAYNFFAY